MQESCKSYRRWQTHLNFLCGTHTLAFMNYPLKICLLKALFTSLVIQVVTFCAWNTCTAFLPVDFIFHPSFGVPFAFLLVLSISCAAPSVIDSAPSTTFPLLLWRFHTAVVISHLILSLHWRSLSFSFLVGVFAAIFYSLLLSSKINWKEPCVLVITRRWEWPNEINKRELPVDRGKLSKKKQGKKVSLNKIKSRRGGRKEATKKKENWMKENFFFLNRPRKKVKFRSL